MFAALERFTELHEQVKRGKLAPHDRPEYDRLRFDLGRMLLLAQGIARSGKTLRTSLRTARVLKVVLKVSLTEPTRTHTIDLASGGFAVLVPMKLGLGRIVEFELAFSGSEDPLKGKAKVASCRPHMGAFRVSFRFEPLSPEDKERLEIAIIDFVLASFRKQQAQARDP